MPMDKDYQKGGEKGGGKGYAGLPDGRPGSERPPGVPMDGVPDAPGEVTQIPRQKS